MPTAPMPFPAQLVRVLGVAFAVALPLQPLMAADRADCNTIGDCLGAAFNLLGYCVVVAPLLAVLGLWLLRVPRAGLVAPSGSIGAFVLVGAVEAITSATESDPPWLLLLPAILLGATAGLMVSGTSGTWVSGLAAAVAVAVVFGGAGFGGNMIQQHRDTAELEAAGVPLYLPDFGDGFEVAYVDGRGPVVVHLYGTSGGKHVDLRVGEMRAGDDSCSALSDVTYFDSTVNACRPEARGFTSRAEYETAVGVTRGETLLIAVVDTRDEVSFDELRAALEGASRISAEEFARL